MSNNQKLPQTNPKLLTDFHFPCNVVISMILIEVMSNQIWQRGKNVNTLRIHTVRKHCGLKSFRLCNMFVKIECPSDWKCSLNS